MRDVLDTRIPIDHSDQVSLQYYSDLVIGRQSTIVRVMDFGCGEGKTFEYFTKQQSDIQWVGLEIEQSSKVREFVSRGRNLCIYDGVLVPFSDACFDLIYSNQVFEHVRYPEVVLKEIRRVLRPGGHFVGSTSYLEPYHSSSLWNYTPYGFCRLLGTAGFEVLEVRPSIDAFTLILRNLLGMPRFFDRWWNRESPLNWIISMLGRLKKKSSFSVNRLKLQFCGQFCFWAAKSRGIEHEE